MILVWICIYHMYCVQCMYNNCTYTISRLCFPLFNQSLKLLEKTYILIYEKKLSELTCTSGFYEEERELNFPMLRKCANLRLPK